MMMEMFCLELGKSVKELEEYKNKRIQQQPAAEMSFALLRKTTYKARE
jgi:hypothetical protein